MRRNKQNEINSKIWLQRKLDHIDCSIMNEDGPGTNGLEDVYLPHQALPGLSWNEISTKTLCFNKNISAPFMINALTGGPPETLHINAALARVAQETGIALAVGSQSIALKNSHYRDSFEIVRKINPDGVVIANVAANIKKELALQAIEMIRADALQLHLNVAQELFMSEGDRDFSCIEDNIADIIDSSPVPIIVKEVGFGISKETARKLLSLGVSWIDIAGSGGTNFIAIESNRDKKRCVTPPLQWGISTAASILEVRAVSKHFNIIASGGIRTPLDALKCFALGADLIAIASPMLEILKGKSEKFLIEYILEFIQDIKRLLLLSGVKSPLEIKNFNTILTGKLREWQLQRDL